MLMETLRTSGNKAWNHPCWRNWFFFALALSFGSALHAQVTFAGTQFGLGAGAWNAPSSVAVDGHGNLYVADSGTNRIVELSSSGAGFSAPITVLSGLSAPGGMAADWSGNLFIADTGTGRILELPWTAQGFGSVVTIASGLSSPNGVAVDSAESLYVADTGANTVLKISPSGSSYGAPVVVGSGFSHPMGVAVDSGRNLLIADTGNNRLIREPYSVAGYLTQQVVGANLNAPIGLALDKSSNLYVAVSGGQQVLEKIWEAGAARFGSSVMIGSGMTSPSGVALSPAGQVFISDAGSNQIMEAVSNSVNFGNVEVGQQGGTLTYNFSLGAGTTLAGVGIVTQGVSGKDFVDGGASTCAAQTYEAASICGVNVSFTPLAAGTRMGAVMLWSSSGSALATAFISGVGESQKAGFIPGTVSYIRTQLSGPTGVAVDGSGNVYIADTGNNRVVEVPWTGGGYGSQTVIPVEGLINPMGMAVDGAGNLYVVSNGNDKVVYLPWTQGGFGAQTKVGSGLYGPSEVAVNSDGTVYICDTLDNRVVSIAWTGNEFAQEKYVGNFSKAPIGVAVDGKGNLYFSDPYQNSVSMLPWSGTRFGDQLSVSVRGTSFPYAVAVDANSDLFVLDAVNNELWMLPWQESGYGPQITVAGGFNNPSGLTIDSNGILYVADTGNNQIVKIDMSSPGALTYAPTYLGSTSSDSPQRVSIGSLGNLPVTLGGLSSAPDFPVDDNAADACASSITLSPSQWCNLAVDFTPTVAGSLSETVAVTDNSLGSEGTQHFIQVSGQGLAKAGQTINFVAPAPTVYGSAPISLTAVTSSGLPVTYAVFSGPGSLSSNGKMLRINGAGTVVVQAAQSGNGDFAPAPPVAVSITIAPAMLTVTAASYTATYGAIPGSFRYTVAGFVNGDSASSAVTGHASVSGGVAPSSGVGSYPLVASQGTLAASNYIFTFVSGALTVVPALLQVHVLPSSHAYGTSLPVLHWNVTGFVNGDGPGTVTGAPVLTTPANSGTPVGTYPIVASAGTLIAANYSFSFGSGNLVVMPTQLTVSANSQSMIYGGALPRLTYSITGFVNGDTAATAIQGSPALSTPATGHSAAGSYRIQASQGNMTSANYTFTFATGTLMVEKAQILVVPNAASTTYGAAFPLFTYSMSGFVNGDSEMAAVGGHPSLTTPANARSVPGSYSITASMGSLMSANYSFAFSRGTVTVAKAVLTAQALPATMTYGGKVPPITYALHGFVNGDTAAQVSGAPGLECSAGSGSPAGSYPIVATLGSLQSANYTFAFLNSQTIVAKAQLVIQPNDISVTFGASMPQMTYSARGLVNGDTLASAVSGSPQMAAEAKSPLPVGVYAIQASMGSLTSKNYSLSFETGKLAVGKAKLTVTANHESMTAGAALPALTYSTAGLVNGDTLETAATGKPNLSTGASSASKAGTYTIVVAPGTMEASNYALSFENGTLTVNQ